MLLGALDLARESAISHNSDVEFRIYSLPDSNNSSKNVLRAYQTFLVNGTGSAGVLPLTKITFLPPQVIISANSEGATLGGSNVLSTLTSSTMDASLALQSPGAAPLYNQTLTSFGTTYQAVCFRFTPQGSVEDVGADSPGAVSRKHLGLVSHPPG